MQGIMTYSRSKQTTVQGTNMAHQLFLEIVLLGHTQRLFFSCIMYCAVEQQSLTVITKIESIYYLTWSSKSWLAPALDGVPL